MTGFLESFVTAAAISCRSCLRHVEGGKGGGGGGRRDMDTREVGYGAQGLVGQKLLEPTYLNDSCSKFKVLRAQVFNLDNGAVLNSFKFYSSYE